MGEPDNNESANSREEETVILVNGEGGETEVKRSVAEQIGVVKTALSKIPVDDTNEHRARSRVKLEGLGADMMKIILGFFEALSKTNRVPSGSEEQAQDASKVYMASLSDKQLNNLCAVTMKLHSVSLYNEVVHELTRRWKIMEPEEIRANYEMEDDMTEEEKRSAEQDEQCVLSDMD